MGEHCMVISGEWRYSPDGKWDFVIDKQRMAVLVVTFEDGMSIEELRKNVLGEFFADGGSRMTVELSYWPPNTSELVTGITTPHVMITSGPSISYFCNHYSVKHAMNLFATFGKRVISTPSSKLMGLLMVNTTPKPTMKSTRFSKDLSGEGLFGLGIDNLGEYVSSVGSRKLHVDLDYDLIVRHMEKVENIMRGGSHTKEDLYDLNTCSERSVRDYVDEMKSEVICFQQLSRKSQIFFSI